VTWFYRHPSTLEVDRYIVFSESTSRNPIRPILLVFSPSSPPQPILSLLDEHQPPPATILGDTFSQPARVLHLSNSPHSSIHFTRPPILRHIPTPTYEYFLARRGTVSVWLGRDIGCASSLRRGKYGNWILLTWQRGKWCIMPALFWLAGWLAFFPPSLFFTLRIVLE